MKRLNELEEQKKAFEEQLIKERATSPLFTKEQFKMALCNFRKLDTNTKEGKAKLIDTFIDRIYLYDDHIKIIYNINGEDEDISLEELESSNLKQCGQPAKRAKLRQFCSFFAYFKLFLLLLTIYRKTIRPNLKSTFLSENVNL